jgi:hypothetical protein
MEFYDPINYIVLCEMDESEGLHRILGALIHIYHEKSKNDNDSEDYKYIYEQLAIAGANIYNNTYEPYPETDTH